MVFYSSTWSSCYGPTLLCHEDFLETGILKVVSYWTCTISILGPQDGSFWTITVTLCLGPCLVDNAYIFYICEHVNQFTILKIPVLYTHIFFCSSWDFSICLMAFGLPYRTPDWVSNRGIFPTVLEAWSPVFRHWLGCCLWRRVPGLQTAVATCLFCT